MFIVFSGVSSSGKNTVMEALMKKRQNLKILEQSSGTTREKRESDARYNTYVYMTKDEFEKQIKREMFFEYELVHGNYYGTIRSRLEQVIDDKEVDYMRDIDVKGVVNLKKFFAGRCPMISIFIDAPNDVLRQRLILRGDKPEDIEKRLGRSDLERSYKVNYDLVVENIDLDQTVDKINDFIENFKKNNER